jgi:hypothetical protein
MALDAQSEVIVDAMRQMGMLPLRTLGVEVKGTIIRIVP